MQAVGEVLDESEFAWGGVWRKGEVAARRGRGNIGVHRGHHRLPALPRRGSGIATYWYGGAGGRAAAQRRGLRSSAAARTGGGAAEGAAQQRSGAAARTGGLAAVRRRGRAPAQRSGLAAAGPGAGAPVRGGAGAGAERRSGGGAVTGRAVTGPGGAAEGLGLGGAAVRRCGGAVTESAVTSGGAVTGLRGCGAARRRRPRTPKRADTWAGEHPPAPLPSLPEHLFRVTFAVTRKNVGAVAFLFLCYFCYREIKIWVFPRERECAGLPFPPPFSFWGERGNAGRTPVRPGGPSARTPVRLAARLPGLPESIDLYTFADGNRVTCRKIVAAQ